jgi:hypothetical protein
LFEHHGNSKLGQHDWSHSLARSPRSLENSLSTRSLDERMDSLESMLLAFDGRSLAIEEGNKDMQHRLEKVESNVNQRMDSIEKKLQTLIDMLNEPNSDITRRPAIKRAPVSSTSGGKSFGPEYTWLGAERR